MTLALSGAIGATGFLTDRASAETTRFITFDARAAAAIYDFSVLAPDIVPLEVPGGVLASTAQARQGPLAFGTAGIAPIPVLTSLGLIIPQKDPVTGQPIPQQFQDAAASIDYTKLPGYCQAAFPASPGTATSAQCGGPSQADPALGFTADGAVGRVTATGDEDDEGSAATTAISRGSGAGITAASAQIATYDATAISSLNAQGVPEAIGRATIAGVSLLGTTVRLEGIYSATDIAYDGTKDGFAGTSSFSVQKASIFGVPVELGPDGFSISGQNAGDPSAMRDLAQQFNDALQIQDFTIRIFPPSPLQRDGSKVSMSSGGVEFSYLRDEVRYTGRLGYTTASVVAVPASTLIDGSGADSSTLGASGSSAPSVGDSSGATAGGGASATSIDGISAGGLGAGADTSPETLPTSQVSVGQAFGTGQQAGNAELLTGLQVAVMTPMPTNRMEQLYLAFAALIGVAALLTRVRSLSTLRRSILR
jgi:hypothetical protein